MKFHPETLAKEKRMFEVGVPRSWALAEEGAQILREKGEPAYRSWMNEQMEPYLPAKDFTHMPAQ